MYVQMIDVIEIQIQRLLNTLGETPTPNYQFHQYAHVTRLY